jgi:alpha-galactosidase
MKRYPKIVVIGAGSASFGLTNLGAIMRTKEFQGATLALCDLNSEGLEQIRRLAERINGEWGAGMTIQASSDRAELLPGADFVVISVAIDREKCWKMDYELGQKYGIMHYAENGGPGGFFHAARNVALLMPVLRDIERLAPGALVLNFTNPMTRICTAAARYTKVNMVGICHQLDFGYMMAGRILGKTLGLDIDHDYLFRWGNTQGEHEISRAAHERLDILAAGINHFTWFLSIEDKETGEELPPLYKKLFLEQTEFEPYTREIISVFDQCPTSGDAHFLEYLPYTSNMQRKTWERMDIQMYPLDGQDENRDRMWKDIADMAAGIRTSTAFTACTRSAPRSSWRRFGATITSTITPSTSPTPTAASPIWSATRLWKCRQYWASMASRASRWATCRRSRPRSATSRRPSWTLR